MNKHIWSHKARKEYSLRKIQSTDMQGKLLINKLDTEQVDMWWNDLYMQPFTHKYDG